MIQKAYKGIIAFMSELRTDLTSKYPDYTTGAWYVEKPDFDQFEELKQQIDAHKIRFIEDLNKILG